MMVDGGSPPPFSGPSSPSRRSKYFDCLTEQTTCVLFNDAILIDRGENPIVFLFFAYHIRSNGSVLSEAMNETVRVCTFNLRRDDTDNGTPNEWSKRRPIVRACLERIQPTILGTQEGYPEQLNEILDDLNQ